MINSHLLAHDIISPTNMKQQLDLDLQSSPSISQTASQNPISSNASFELPLNVTSMSKLPFKYPKALFIACQSP
jgi:hypothetical protein